MMGSIKRGALIVIEGTDRSGKSTQCKKLVDSLKKRNIPSILMNFPDRSTQTGKLIDEYLTNKECNINDHTIHLLFSANRWENVKKMESILYDGITLIVDRYSYSGIAFSAIKKNMDLQWCKYPEIGLPKPDLVFLLTLSEADMLKRPGFGNERYENLEIQGKVSDMFHRFCSEEENWMKIDAAGSVDEVQNQLLRHCIPKIEEVKQKPVEFLTFSSIKNNS